MTLKGINQVVGIVVILASVTIASPLTILTVKSGGPWGFGIVGLGMLMPLSAYVLFGCAALINSERVQRIVFIGGHATTIIAGPTGMIIFPLYQLVIAFVPIVLALAGIIGYKYYRYNLLVMLLLAVIANAVLLKWELDFGRTLPLLQLFK